MWDQCNPFVWGDWVVWCDARNADDGWSASDYEYDMYGKNLATGKEVAISTAEGGQHANVIYENIVAYRVESDPNELRLHLVHGPQHHAGHEGRRGHIELPETCTTPASTATGSRGSREDYFFDGTRTTTSTA